jgi:hypothetical protein
LKEIIEKTILTNEERLYFGLEPILPEWERVEIKNGYVVYFDGNIIRKTISYSTLSGEEYKNYLDYLESDNEIITRNRETVLPRTDKGKEKKLNYTSINGMKATGCSFRMNFMHPNRTATIWVGNLRNSISLPIAFPNNIDNISAYRKWLSAYIAACPSDYFEKVERMKNAPHQTVKYYNGDIFRFEVDMEHYGFGLIIGQVRQLQKDGLLPEQHILNNTMCVPLLVRLYQFKTKSKNISLDEITKHALGSTFLMADNNVIWGVYDIVGSKALNTEDILFPIQAGDSLSYRNPYTRLCWGLGMIVTNDKLELPEEIHQNQLMRHGVNLSINRRLFENALAVNSNDSAITKLEQNAFQCFGVALNTDFDTFNRQHDGKTREEYAAYANKTMRKK